jgi:hypothetical protein
LLKPAYLGAGMAFRRSLLNLALPFPRRIPMHDLWLGLLADSLGGARFLPQPLLLYRRHGANVSQTTGTSSTPYHQRIVQRIRLLGLIGWRRITRPGRLKKADR